MTRLEICLFWKDERIRDLIRPTHHLRTPLNGPKRTIDQEVAIVRDGHVDRVVIDGDAAGSDGVGCGSVGDLDHIPAETV